MVGVSITPAANPDDNPTFSWAGKEWPVPEMPPKQLSAVWDDILIVTIALDETEKVERLPENADSQAKAVAGLKLIQLVYSLTGEQYDRMRNVVYHGLKIAHPDLTREEFDAVSTNPTEMHFAFRRVRTQSHMYDIRLSAGGAPQTGETKAAGKPPIGNT